MGRNRFAWCLDTLLFLALLLLLSPRLTGLPVHEWLGIAITVPLLVHLLLAWSWIAAAARRLRQPRRPREVANSVLNAFLFVAATVVVVSGLVISQVALRQLGVATINDRAWRGMHNRWTTWLWIGASAHIAMNWRWIVTATRSYIPGRRARQ